MNRISLLRSIDKIIGRPLTTVLPHLRECRGKASEKPESILIIRPGGIGDAVLLLPAIKSLREKFPESVIDVLCEKRNAGIFGLSSDIDKIYLYDKWADIFRCFGNTYAIAIDTEQWHRLSAVVAYLTKAPMRIGFDTNERRNLFTHGIPYSHDDYEVYSFSHLVAPLIDGIFHFEKDKPFIDRADGIGSYLVPEMTEKVIAVFPGASVKERRWGGEKFGMVARAMRDRGYRTVILGSHAEKTDAFLIKKNVADSIDLTGKTSMRDVAEVLKKCRVLITGDSGLMHIAYAAGTPTVSLFGPGRDKKWGPRGEKHIMLNKHLACSPCTTFGYTPHCNNKLECLSSITADEVTIAVEKLLL